MLSQLQFTLQLHRAVGDYKAENRWFTNAVTKSTYDYTRRKEDALAYYISHAWMVYKNVFEGKADPILLGNSLIRREQELVLSFGILSANEQAQEPDFKPEIDKVTRKREMIFAGAAADLQAAPETTCTGAILSTVGWSPMLNDAMIIAGVTRQIEFVYVLSSEEQNAFELYRHYYNLTIDEVRLPTATDQETWARDRSNRSEKLWRSFFSSETEALWKNNVPRMFVREMLGLQHFGYQAILDEGQITFRPNGGMPPSFDEYLLCLRNVSFHQNAKRTILASVAQFLFNDATALSNF